MTQVTKSVKNIIKAELTALATEPKKSWNGTTYGDGTVYVNGEKYSLEEYNTNTVELRKEISSAKTSFYSKQMDVEDAYIDNDEAINYEEVKTVLLFWIAANF